MKLPVITYYLGTGGTTKDPTAEKLEKEGDTPKAVPKVEGLDKLVFKGWSEVDPSTLKDGKLPTLVGRHGQ